MFMFEVFVTIWKGKTRVVLVLDLILDEVVRFFCNYYFFKGVVFLSYMLLVCVGGIMDYADLMDVIIDLELNLLDEILF